ncbi:protein of unknown function [Paraburkholderia kururiensis]
MSNPVHAPADFCMAQSAVHAERVDDTKRPTVSGMGEHLPPQPIIIGSQAVTNGLRIFEKFVSVQLSGSQYHACAFFYARPCIARLPQRIPWQARQ